MASHCRVPPFWNYGIRSLPSGATPGWVRLAPIRTPGQLRRTQLTATRARHSFSWRSDLESHFVALHPLKTILALGSPFRAQTTAGCVGTERLIGSCFLWRFHGRHQFFDYVHQDGPERHQDAPRGQLSGQAVLCQRNVCGSSQRGLHGARRGRRGRRRRRRIGPRCRWRLPPGGRSRWCCRCRDHQQLLRSCRPAHHRHRRIRRHRGSWRRGRRRIGNAWWCRRNLQLPECRYGRWWLRRRRVSGKQQRDRAQSDRRGQLERRYRPSTGIGRRRRDLRRGGLGLGKPLCLARWRRWGCFGWQQGRERRRNVGRWRQRLARGWCR